MGMNFIQGCKELLRIVRWVASIGVVKWAKGAMPPPKFLENIVISYFESLFPNKVVLFAKNQTFFPPK